MDRVDACERYVPLGVGGHVPVLCTDSSYYQPWGTSESTQGSQEFCVRITEHDVWGDANCPLNTGLCVKLLVKTSMFFLNFCRTYIFLYRATDICFGTSGDVSSGFNFCQPVWQPSRSLPHTCTQALVCSKLGPIMLQTKALPTELCRLIFKNLFYINYTTLSMAPYRKSTHFWLLRK